MFMYLSGDHPTDVFKTQQNQHSTAYQSTAAALQYCISSCSITTEHSAATVQKLYVWFMRIMLQCMVCQVSSLGRPKMGKSDVHAL